MGSGDGKSIDVWSDPWLSRQPSFRVISLRPQGYDIERVEKLIDPLYHTWREDVVRNTFLPFEAEEVLSIPLFSMALDDIYAWYYTTNGQYSVKSGYHFINFYKSSLNGEPSSSVVSDLWKKIWRIHIPPKVRSFIWRMCSCALPTCVGLHKRIASIGELCPRCGREEETEVHALLRCPFVSGVWEDAGLHNLVEWVPFVSIADWYAWVMRTESRVIVEEAAMVAWFIWYERNKVRLGGEDRPTCDVATAALNILGAYKEARECHHTPHGVDNERVVAVWCPPLYGTLKINVDAAVSDGMGVGLGVVIRDHDGMVVRAASSQVKGV